MRAEPAAIRPPGAHYGVLDRKTSENRETREVGRESEDLDFVRLGYTRIEPIDVLPACLC
jgi:hypothetical protein